MIEDSVIPPYYWYFSGDFISDAHFMCESSEKYNLTEQELILLMIGQEYIGIEDQTNDRYIGYRMNH